MCHSGFSLKISWIFAQQKSPRPTNWVVSTQLTKIRIGTRLPNFGPITSFHQPKYLKQIIKLQGWYYTLFWKYGPTIRPAMKGKWCSFQGYQKKPCIDWWYGWWKKSWTIWGFQNSVVAITDFLPGQLVCQNSFMNKWHNFWVIPVLSVEGGQSVGSDVPFTSPKTNMEPQKTTGFVQISFCFNFRAMAFSVLAGWCSRSHESLKKMILAAHPWVEVHFLLTVPDIKPFQKSESASSKRLNLPRRFWGPLISRQTNISTLFQFPLFVLKESRNLPRFTAFAIQPLRKKIPGTSRQISPREISYRGSKKEAYKAWTSDFLLLTVKCCWVGGSSQNIS